MKPLKVLFFGTSSFAAHILSHLLRSQINIVAVVTRPDRPQGRNLKIACSPVKQLVIEEFPNLVVLQPEKASTPEFAEKLNHYAADLFIVVAYGEILRKMILEIPKKGAINVHASLLPKYRGAAPIQRCLMDGVSETGITLIAMNERMDAGDVLAMQKIAVAQDMNFQQLERKLCELACSLLHDTILQIQEGRPPAHTIQFHDQATFAPKLSPEEEKINWSYPAIKIHNLIRALSPRPGAWTHIQINGEQKRLKILAAEVTLAAETISANEWVVACGEQALRIKQVQLEGKKASSTEEFLRGLRSSPILS